MSLVSSNSYPKLKSLLTDGRKEKLLETVQLISKNGPMDTLTKIQAIVLIEMVDVITANDNDTIRLVHMIRLYLIANSNMFQEYIDTYELWCNSLLFYHRNEIVTLLLRFYYHTSQYDKYLECTARNNSLIVNESTLFLAIVYTKCSMPNIPKVVKLLKHETIKNIITFVANTVSRDSFVVPQILINLSKYNHISDEVKNYIENFILQYITDPENMKFVIQTDYISCKVFIQMGLHMCNPVNTFDETSIQHILYKINSIMFLATESELSLLNLCKSLASLDYASIKTFFDSPIFLTLSRRQRSEIYIAAYISIRDINLNEAIGYLTQAMVCGEIKNDIKLTYMADIIKYFSSTLDHRTYNFYIREFAILAPDGRNISESIMSVLEICLHKRDYNIVDNLLKIISDKPHPVNPIRLAETLYESDHPEHLKNGIKYLTEAMRFNTGDISHLCIMLNNLSNKLQNTSRKRSTPLGSRLEKIAEKRAHSNYRNVCYNCNRRFHSQVALDKHTLECKGALNTLYHCKNCNRGFSSSSGLKSHLISKNHIVE